MALTQRRQKILDLIREDGRAKVQNLASIFKVSEVTIRQDLEALEKLGYIQREYGGAFLKDVGTFAKTGLVLNQTNMEAKQHIARKALAMINDGDSIILDSGSTVTELAKLLIDFKNLTVITNAINIAMILGENPNINLIVSGGEFKAPTLSLTGDLACPIFKDIHVDKLFLATAGISTDYSLTYPSFSDLAVKSAMIRSASKIYLLADATKLGYSSFVGLGRISLIDTLITDPSISEKQLADLKKMNVEVIY